MGERSEKLNCLIDTRPIVDPADHLNRCCATDGWIPCFSAIGIHQPHLPHTFSLCRSIDWSRYSTASSRLLVRTRSSRAFFSPTHPHPHHPKKSDSGPSYWPCGNRYAPSHRPAALFVRREKMARNKTPDAGLLGPKRHPSAT